MRLERAQDLSVERRVGLQPMCLAELMQLLVTLERLALRGPAYLLKALGTEGQGARVGFRATVGPTHVALVGLAVGYGENMAQLVACNLDCVEEAAAKVFGAFVRVAVAVDGPNPHTLVEIGLTKHKVPSSSRPQVGACQSDEGGCISRHSRLKYLVQDISAEDLLVAPGGVLASSPRWNQRKGQRLVHFDRAAEVQTQEFGG